MKFIPLCLFACLSAVLLNSCFAIPDPSPLTASTRSPQASLIPASATSTLAVISSTTASATAIPSPTFTRTPTNTTTAEPVVPSTPVVEPNYICPYAEPGGSTPVYKVKVIHEYPHNPTSYTQGLVFRDGSLYESTGLYGQSALLQVDLQSGKELKRQSLAEEFFGEGMTELENRIYQLTYRESLGFIYDRSTLANQGQFTITSEGWGLDHDGKYLIRSDGSEVLYFIDPATFQTVRLLTIFSEWGRVTSLNELEFIDGEIWANIFLTTCIARIDPVTGMVTGWIDLGNLLTPEEAEYAQMPNGIAYDPVRKRIFVTGKFWPKLFEIDIYPVD